MRRRALLAASGGEISPIDFVPFDGNTIFDTRIYGDQNIYIEVKFRRTDTASNVYLYGVSTSPRLTANLAQSGYWRYGESVYPTFNTKNTNVIEAQVTPTKTKVGSYSKTYSQQYFTTKFTIPLGGHTPSSGVPTPQFIGEVYYFRIYSTGYGEVTKFLCDWMPAKNADGVEGFYDSLTNTFIAPL